MAAVKLVPILVAIAAVILSVCTIMHCSFVRASITTADLEGPGPFLSKNLKTRLMRTLLAALGGKAELGIGIWFGATGKMDTCRRWEPRQWEDVAGRVLSIMAPLFGVFGMLMGNLAALDVPTPRFCGCFSYSMLTILSWLVAFVCQILILLAVPMAKEYYEGVVLDEGGHLCIAATVLYFCAALGFFLVDKLIDTEQLESTNTMKDHKQPVVDAAEQPGEVK